MVRVSIGSMCYRFDNWRKAERELRIMGFQPWENGNWHAIVHGSFGWKELLATIEKEDER